MLTQSRGDGKLRSTVWLFTLCYHAWSFVSFTIRLVLLVIAFGHTSTMKFKTATFLEAARAHRTNLISFASLKGKVVLTILPSIFAFGVTFWAPNWLHKPWKKGHQLKSKSKIYELAMIVFMLILNFINRFFFRNFLTIQVYYVDKFLLHRPAFLQ